MPIETTNFLSGAFNAVMLGLFAWAAFGEAACRLIG
jgi:hypothetical protein